MTRREKGTKRKIQQTKYHSPKEDISSSDEDYQDYPKKKKTFKKKTKMSSSSSSSSSSSDDDDESNYEEKEEDTDVDDEGNIKNLISYSDEEEENENVCTCPPESAFIHFDENEESKSLNGFLNSIMGNKGSNKADQIRKRINGSSMTDDMKKKLNKKLDKSPHLDAKQEEWFEYVLSIPFGKFSPLPIDVEKDDIEKYFTNLMDSLNKAVYGLDNVKEEIVTYVAQCLTSKNPSPRILALQGVAGSGKTQIVRNGIAKVLGTPMQTFSMGGIKDSSHFVGFDYTYQNSKHGAIAQSLMDSGVMNPVIFLDELDKISDWYEGEEVKNLLIHMTDPVQNHEFKDKYFEGINIDLSRVIFIFAFNEIEKINPILRDRLHIIKISNPTDKDKLIIANTYTINEVLQSIPLSKSDFHITDGAMMNIIQNYSNKNTGMRSVKDCIKTILLKINTLKLLGKSTIKKIGLSFNHESNEDKKRERDNKDPILSYTFPIVVDENNIKAFLGSHEPIQDDKYLSMYM